MITTGSRRRVGPSSAAERRRARKQTHLIMGNDPAFEGRAIQWLSVCGLPGLTSTEADDVDCMECLEYLAQQVEYALEDGPFRVGANAYQTLADAMESLPPLITDDTVISIDPEFYMSEALPSRRAGEG